MKCVWMHDMCG